MLGVYYDGTSVRLRRDLPAPEPGPGEIRLRVLLAGICDTDLQIARGYMGFRGVLGHEFVGVDDTGRRFAVEINNACRDCPTCSRGLHGHCPNRTVTGILGHDGAMAEWICVPEANLHALPDSMGSREAVFVEPLAAAFRIAEQVTIGPATAVAVLGDGKLGLLCAWALATTGAPVELVGKHPAKLALAGPDIRTHHLGEAEALARRFDVVVDATGSPTGLPTALKLVRPCGTVVLKTTVAGAHDGPLAPIVIDEVRVVGSRCGPFATAIDALARGLVDVRPLVEAVFPLADVEDAFRAAAQPGARKVLLQV